jgi:hypothetical protein
MSGDSSEKEVYWFALAHRYKTANNPLTGKKAGV